MSNIAQAITITNAIALAADAHGSQLDKQDKPYIFHPIRVMLKLSNPIQQIIGVLHDVIEDTVVTLDDMKLFGFDKTVIFALDAITRHIDEPYKDYIDRLMYNPDACIVKIADLQDNLDESRGPIPSSLRDRYYKTLIKIQVRMS